jgi:transposase-like protein
MRNPILPDLSTTWTEHDARQVLDEWRQSGQTIAAFARERGVSAPRLYWWRRRVPQAIAIAPAMSLVPAKIVVRPEAAATVIRLPSGIAIEIANASPSLVAAIVSELERSP